MCEAGLVLVNGGVAKSATTIKVGDEIVLRRGEHVTKVRVVSMPATRQTSRSQAGTLYEFVDETSD
jgi:ribosomal 50S subunit-recycling heat shock protein